jgi:hypothetical protein
MKYQPAYTITPAIVHLVAEIGEIIGRCVEPGQIGGPGGTGNVVARDSNYLLDQSPSLR